MVAGWPDLFTAIPLSGAEFDTEIRAVPGFEPGLALWRQRW